MKIMQNSRIPGCNCGNSRFCHSEGDIAKKCFMENLQSSFRDFIFSHFKPGTYIVMIVQKKKILYFSRYSEETEKLNQITRYFICRQFIYSTWYCRKYWVCFRCHEGKHCQLTELKCTKCNFQIVYIERHRLRIQLWIYTKTVSF